MGTNVKATSNNYLKFLLRGARKEAQAECDAYLYDGNSIQSLYEKVMKPALYEVGRLWEQNKITVATEHLATATTEGILNSFYSQIVPEKYNNKKVVLACVEKEEHQVGIKMVADIFEMHQWESFFLGRGFPAAELIKYIREIDPDLIAFSLSVYFNFPSLIKIINNLIETFPGLPIIIGGQALVHLSENDLKQWTDITYISDLNQLEEYILNQN